MTEKAAPRAPYGAVLAGAALAFCGGGLVVGFFLSDSLVTSRARDALVERGVVCDERFSLDVDWSLSTVSIAPTRCQLVALTFADAVEIPEGGSATLSGLSVNELRIPSARVYLVESPRGPTVDLGPMGALGAVGDVGTRVGATAQAASELAAHRPVPTLIDRIELMQSGEAVVTIEALAVAGEGPITLNAAHVRFQEMAGPMGTTATADLETLVGTASASTCHLEGDLNLSARMPILGVLSHEVHVTLDGSALEGPTPLLRASLAAP